MKNITLLLMALVSTLAFSQKSVYSESDKLAQVSYSRGGGLEVVISKAEDGAVFISAQDCGFREGYKEEFIAPTAQIEVFDEDIIALMNNEAVIVRREGDKSGKRNVSWSAIGLKFENRMDLIFSWPMLLVDGQESEALSELLSFAKANRSELCAREGNI